jgi:drug/metabolite transporter (DMT)-like permease
MNQPAVEGDQPVPARSQSVAAARPKAALGWVLAAFAAVYLIWGSTYLGITIAVKTIPPFLMAGVRFIIAGGALYFVMRRLGVSAPTRRQWISASIIGALLILAGNGGVSWAQGRVPSGVTALIIASVPLWIMLVDWLRPRGLRPTPRVLLGLAVGGTGVVLIILSRDPLGNRAIDPVGAGVVLGASLCWAFGSIYSRHAVQPASALMSVSMQMLAGGVLQLLTRFPPPRPWPLPT